MEPVVTLHYASPKKVATRRLKLDESDSPKAKLPRSSWVGQTKNLTTLGVSQIKYDGSDEYESQGHISTNETFGNSLKKITAEKIQTEDEMRLEKEHKKGVFGLKLSSKKNTSPRGHSHSVTELPSALPVHNTNTNANTNTNKPSYSRQRSLSSLTKDVSILKFTRGMSRPKLLRTDTTSSTTSFRSTISFKGSSISRIFSKNNNKPRGKQNSKKIEDSSKNSNENHNDSNHNHNFESEISAETGAKDSNKVKQKSNNSDTLNENKSNNNQLTEGDQSIVGTDYDYFINSVCRLPRPSSIFDIQLADINIMFDLGEQLGSGGYSIVRCGIDKQTKQKRALKLIEINVYKKHKIRMEAEVAVLSVTDHPGIIHLYGVVRTPTYFCLVMELFKGYELFEEITRRPNGFDEAEACCIITAVLEAIDHLHSQGVIHRDIKPENFLVSFDEENNGNLKLIDFGFATFQNPESDMIGTSCGTLDYIAPELLLEFPHNQAVDMWSVGVVLYILLCGFPPFFAEDDDTVFDLITKGSYDFPSPQWDDISEEARHLVSCLLQFDVSERWTASQSLSHSWIVKNSLLNSQKLLNIRIGHK